MHANLSLIYLKQVNIKSESDGLNETSRLVLANNQQDFLVISDDKKRIFTIDFDGNLKPKATIHTSGKQLESIKKSIKLKAQLIIPTIKNYILLAIAKRNYTFTNSKIVKRSTFETTPFKRLRRRVCDSIPNTPKFALIARLSKLVS